MGKFLWSKSLKTNGEDMIKYMVFIVFSSATFLHWCLFFTWSVHIGERPNHKVISVWTQQVLPGQAYLMVWHKGVEYLKQGVCFHLTML